MGIWTVMTLHGISMFMFQYPPSIFNDLLLFPLSYSSPYFRRCICTTLLYWFHLWEWEIGLFQEFSLLNVTSYIWVHTCVHWVYLGVWHSMWYMCATRNGGMEEVSIEIRETKEKIRQAEADGDRDYVKTLTSYLVELQRNKNVLLSAPSGESHHTFSYISLYSDIIKTYIYIYRNEDIPLFCMPYRADSCDDFVYDINHTSTIVWNIRILSFCIRRSLFK